jgi:hypothetical protein
MTGGHGPNGAFLREPFNQLALAYQRLEKLKICHLSSVICHPDELQASAAGEYGYGYRPPPISRIVPVT